MSAIIFSALLLLLGLTACGGGGDHRSAARNPQLIAAARAGDADRVRSLLESGPMFTLATPPPSSLEGVWALIAAWGLAARRAW